MNALKGGSIQRSNATLLALARMQITISQTSARSSRTGNDFGRATRPYGEICRTLFMMTASTGTSSKPRRRAVWTAAILSITSMPSVTLAKTA